MRHIFVPRNLLRVFNSNRLHVRFLSIAGSDRIVPATNYLSWNSKDPVRIHFRPDRVPDNYPPILVETMFRRVVDKYPDHLAVVANRSGNEWNLKWSYERYYSEVISAAKGFISLGLRPSHAVGIMANNSPAWFVSSLASIFAGGLACGIHLTNSSEAVAFIASHAPTDILVLEDAELLRQVLGSRSIDEAFPNVAKFVLIEDNKTFDSSRVISWNGLIKLGEAQTDFQLIGREEAQAVNKACMLVYTSGTTGPPKGALLSHDNVTYSTRISMEHYKWRENAETLLSYLPMSHAAAHLIDGYMLMYRAGTVYIADKEALKGTLVDNLRAARPTRFVGVPRVWEKIQEKMEEVGRKSGPAKRALGNWAKSCAKDHHQKVRMGLIKSSDESLQFKLAKKLIFSRIHDALGLNRTKEMPVSAASTAAPLSRSTFDYFESLDLQISELFGCTEATGPISTNLHGPDLRPGTVGRRFLGVNSKIYNPDHLGFGEIVFKSRNIFMGFHLDEERTKEAFTSDNWFRTGDLGKFDEDGFLILSGRLKELIITAGGKNVAPVPIEERIKASLCDVISNVVAIGDRRKYLSCLLTLKVNVDAKTSQPSDVLSPEAVAWCDAVVPESRGKVLTVQDFREGTFANQLKRAIEGRIEVANEQALSQVEKIRKFSILPREFSISGGELGPTLKLKRYAVAEMYEKEIEAMYSENHLM